MRQIGRMRSRIRQWYYNSSGKRAPDDLLVSGVFEICVRWLRNTFSHELV